MRPGAPQGIDLTLLHALDGGLWHATDEAGFAGISEDQQIRPDARAGHTNAFCRSIGAVSLFDLARPDTAFPSSAAHWSLWLTPFSGGAAYWFEIDRRAAVHHVLSPEATLARWNVALEAGDPNLRIISGIEAAHMGAIPLSCVCRCLLINEMGWEPVLLR